MLRLAAGGYALDLEPAEGGAVARFDWEGEALFRPRCGDGPLNSACFPLVPFSNRIALGRFSVNGRDVALASNFPGSDHPHTLHGFGWLRAWDIVEAHASSATLTYAHEPDAWPWRFQAEQIFALDAQGLRHEIRVRNLSDEEMPAGLGVHPYFPSALQTRYLGLHRGEWMTRADGLPLKLERTGAAQDWWQGRPVSDRAVDTVYTDREGALSIFWPERDLGLTIEPSEALRFTVVYSPPNADFFCVEPVSHETDAVNRTGDASGLRWLGPRETFSAHVHYSAHRVSART